MKAGRPPSDRTSDARVPAVVCADASRSRSAVWASRPTRRRGAAGGGATICTTPRLPAGRRPRASATGAAAQRRGLDGARHEADTKSHDSRLVLVGRGRPREGVTLETGLSEAAALAVGPCDPRRGRGWRLTGPTSSPTRPRPPGISAARAHRASRSTEPGAPRVPTPRPQGGRRARPSPPPPPGPRRLSEIRSSTLA